MSYIFGSCIQMRIGAANGPVAGQDDPSWKQGRWSSCLEAGYNNVVRGGINNEQQGVGEEGYVA